MATSSVSDAARIRLVSPRTMGAAQEWTRPYNFDQLGPLLQQDSNLYLAYPFLVLILDSLVEAHLEIQDQHPDIALDLALTSAVRVHSTATEAGPVVELSAGFLAQLVNVCLHSSLLLRADTDLDGFWYSPDEELWADSSDTSKWLLRGTRWARCAIFFAYYHEIVHLAFWHADYVAEVTRGAPGDAWQAGPALVSAQQAFEADADRGAITLLLLKQEQSGSDGDGRDLGSTLALAGFGLHVLAELLSRMDFGLDGVALFRSRMGSYQEGRVHPGIAQRRFQLISWVWGVAESPELGRAAETAITYGVGLAQRCLSVVMAEDPDVSLAASDRTGIFLADVQDDSSISDYFAYSLELEGRLAWLRRRQSLPEIADNEQLTIRERDGAL